MMQNAVFGEGVVNGAFEYAHLARRIADIWFVALTMYDARPL